MSEQVSGSEPVEIEGVIEDEVGEPRNDGSRGSGLYKVPLQLSVRPSPTWGRLFVETWNHPPRFTTMHRPGIASVVGDKIILNGTTIEEVEKHHAETLRLVVDKVNADAAVIEERERKPRGRRGREAQAPRPRGGGIGPDPVRIADGHRQSKDRYFYGRSNHLWFRSERNPQSIVYAAGWRIWKPPPIPASSFGLPRLKLQHADSLSESRDRFRPRLRLGADERWVLGSPRGDQRAVPAADRAGTEITNQRDYVRRRGARAMQAR